MSAAYFKPCKACAVDPEYQFEPIAAGNPINYELMDKGLIQLHILGDEFCHDCETTYKRLNTKEW